MEHRKIFPLVPQEKRYQTNSILVTPVGNLSMKKFPMLPPLRTKLPFLSTLDIEKYFYDTLQLKQLPYHFLVSKHKDDWIVSIGAPLNCESNFINESIRYGYLPMAYSKTIVIAFQDDCIISLLLHLPDLRHCQTT